ncbi:MAG: hypothetical protein Q7S28_02355 [bacterium]|nr:hypothetical protein [bacterium]
MEPTVVFETFRKAVNGAFPDSRVAFRGGDGYNNVYHIDINRIDANRFNTTLVVSCLGDRFILSRTEWWADCSVTRDEVVPDVMSALERTIELLNDGKEPK